MTLESFIPDRYYRSTTKIIKIFQIVSTVRIEIKPMYVPFSFNGSETIEICTPDYACTILFRYQVYARTKITDRFLFNQLMKILRTLKFKCMLNVVPKTQMEQNPQLQYNITFSIIFICVTTYLVFYCSF